MPELPDIESYRVALETRLVGESLVGIRIARPFFLRSVTPSVDAFVGQRVRAISRLGKRLVIECENDYFGVLHLMIAGRLHWKDPMSPIHKGRGQAAFDFPKGSLMVTEAGKKRRASLHLVHGRAELHKHDPGGKDPLSMDLQEFIETLRARNHTLKRALTDPRIFSGIGNAYSDEILHHAKLSPIKWTSRLTDDEITALHRSIGHVLTEWTERLCAEARDTFPTKVTAFRPEMAVHGKYGDPCPDCGDPVQRIVRKDREVNYCPTCQTDGTLLADRALSRLLKNDWPRTLEELEEMRTKTVFSPSSR